MRQRSALSASPADPSAEAWIAQIFLTRAERSGVVRRSIAGVDHEIRRGFFITEVRRRGFHLLETRNPSIVVCNRDPVEKLF
ncbi:N-(5'-phosphoribosyl)anthranilate isomerase [Neotabrizicola sp. sgz301269]|uniref:N-(5'-phosphoribosyl)anthranilate isomerase n=1 Tax=Neotabrizicola sp. sgz301269 TaxID=3276282 RepID=UPI00376F5F88